MANYLFRNDKIFIYLFYTDYISLYVSLNYITCNKEIRNQNINGKDTFFLIRQNIYMLSIDNEEHKL